MFRRQAPEVPGRPYRPGSTDPSVVPGGQVAIDRRAPTKARLRQSRTPFRSSLQESRTQMQFEPAHQACPQACLSQK